MSIICIFKVKWNLNIKSNVMQLEFLGTGTKAKAKKLNADFYPTYSSPASYSSFLFTNKLYSSPGYKSEPIE